ncbi:hypothetical protein HYV73_04530 [Candidatus Uhrbacteria bacterium]|nr:hypothetical protein [Candidatus Uhrbacteria bacterium]
MMERLPSGGAIVTAKEWRQKWDDQQLFSPPGGSIVVEAIPSWNSRGLLRHSRVGNTELPAGGIKIVYADEEHSVVWMGSFGGKPAGLYRVERGSVYFLVAMPTLQRSIALSSEAGGWAAAGSVPKEPHLIQFVSAYHALLFPRRPLQQTPVFRDGRLLHFQKEADGNTYLRTVLLGNAKRWEGRTGEAKVAKEIADSPLFPLAFYDDTYVAVADLGVEARYFKEAAAARIPGKLQVIRRSPMGVSHALVTCMEDDMHGTRTCVRLNVEKDPILSGRIFQKTVLVAWSPNEQQAAIAYEARTAKGVRQFFKTPHDGVEEIPEGVKLISFLLGDNGQAHSRVFIDAGHFYVELLGHIVGPFDDARDLRHEPLGSSVRVYEEGAQRAYRIRAAKDDSPPN